MSQTAVTSAPSRSAGFVRTIIPAAIAAAVTAVITYLIFDAAGADYLVTMMGDDITVSAGRSAFMGALMTLIGGTIAFFVARRTGNPARTFTAFVIVGLLVMLPGPITSADETLTIVALEVMHLVVAAAVLAIVVPQLRKHA